MLELYYTILHYIGISYYIRIKNSNPAIILALTFILDKEQEQSVLRITYTEAL